MVYRPSNLGFARASLHPRLYAGTRYAGGMERMVAAEGCVGICLGHDASKLAEGKRKQAYGLQRLLLDD